MGKHIQGRDGKMKGSIGSGKKKVPTAGRQSKSRAAKDDKPSDSADYSGLLAAFQGASEGSHPRVPCGDLKVGDIVLVRNPYRYEPVEIVDVPDNRFHRDRWLITIRSAAGRQRRWVNSAGSMQLLRRAGQDAAVN
jgi:hypothetical protein